MKPRHHRPRLPQSAPEDVRVAAATVAGHLRGLLAENLRVRSRGLLSQIDETRVLHAFRVMEALSESEARS